MKCGKLKEKKKKKILEIIQNLCKSIPSRKQAVLQVYNSSVRINKESCIFHDTFHYFVYPL
jgi:hypothetical protein